MFIVRTKGSNANMEPRKISSDFQPHNPPQRDTDKAAERYAKKLIAEYNKRS